MDSCSISGCESQVVQYWPAFDRNLNPAPYCAEHLADAKRHTVLDGPRFIQPRTERPALVTV